MKRITHHLALGAALVAMAALAAGCSRNPAKPDWQLVWQDEFTGAAGQSPDPSRWVFDVGTDWGNAQLEHDTARPENVSLDGNGNLAITARAEVYQGRNYTSGRINTRRLFQQAGGRFEARMRMPRGQGMWPAFWLLGANLDTAPWPACGEIDILEYRGQSPNAILGSLHGPGYSGGNPISRSYTVPGPSLDTEFRLYAVEWTSDSITWFIDDKMFGSVPQGGQPAGTPWVFNQPFFIILNLAVGGNFVGPPDASTVFPQQLLVDYVRVYRRG